MSSEAEIYEIVQTHRFSILRLLGKDRLDSLTDAQRPFARDEDGGLPLLDVVKKVGPSILLGMCTICRTLELVTNT